MNTESCLKIKSLSPQLVVSNLDSSIKYYQLLGFEIKFLYDDFYASVTKDGYSINLKLGKPAKEEPEGEDLDIVFSIELIEKLFGMVKNNSLNIVQPLREMPYGREFYLADPDGYLLSFIESN